MQDNNNLIEQKQVEKEIKRLAQAAVKCNKNIINKQF